MSKCVFCGHSEVQSKLANAEGGLVLLPVCRGDQWVVDESFSRPFTTMQLIKFQRECV